MKKPDQVTLERWLAGELDGEALRHVESWAEAYPEDLSKELGLDTISQQLSQNLPASEDPPYPEFFNHKIQQAIQAENIDEIITPIKRASWLQRFSWVFAPSAAAAMALCYYLGTLTVQPVVAEDKAVTEVDIPTEIYLPQSGVSAEVSNVGDATIIVLDGLKQIPDSLDIISSASVDTKETPRMVRQNDDEIY